jgi:flagellin-specific chaperone FliS
MSTATAERVLHLYEQGLEGCANRSAPQVSRALLALIATLDFEDSTPVTEGFYRLYNYCLRNALEHRFDRVAWILNGLREAWAESARAAGALAS